MAEQQNRNLDHRLQAHHAAWTTQLFIGNNSKSRFHTLQGDSLYDIDKHRNHAFNYGGHDPGVCAKTTASEALLVSRGKCGIFANRRQLNLNKFYRIATDDWQIQSNLRAAFAVNYSKAICVLKDIQAE